MTRQVSYGIIHGHSISVTIHGPPSDSIPEGDGRVGSDELMARIEEALAGVKQEVENNEESDFHDCPECPDQFNHYVGLRNHLLGEHDMRENLVSALITRRVNNES